MKKMLFAVLVAVLSHTASAQTSVPNTFVAGQPASAAQVNANFQALVSAVNALTARVTKLEGTVAASDLVGTYAFYGLQTEIDNLGVVQNASYTGTCTVSLPNSFSCTTTEVAANNQGGTGFSLTTSPSNFSGTFVLSGNSFAVTPSGGGVGLVFSLAAGGQILVGVQATPNGNAPSGGEDMNMNILVRT